MTEAEAEIEAEFFFFEFELKEATVNSNGPISPRTYICTSFFILGEYLY